MKWRLNFMQHAPPSVNAGWAQQLSRSCVVSPGQGAKAEAMSLVMAVRIHDVLEAAGRGPQFPNAQHRDRPIWREG